MGKQTRLQARNPNGNSIELTRHETDSPVLPVAQLEQLHGFRPDLVDWVAQQTEKEAAFRHTRLSRVIVAAGYLALNGQETVASILGGGTLVALVTVLVRGKRASKADA